MTERPADAERSAAEGQVDGLVDPSLVGAVPAELGRHRRHRFPARGHVVKVLYDDGERAAVGQAASLAGLRPSSYVAAAALLMAQQVLEPPSPAGEAGEGLAGNTAEGQGRVVGSVREGRELLVELMQARLALRRFGVNVNQAAAVLNSGGDAPVWLERAVAGGDRAVARVDAAAAAVARRLG